MQADDAILELLNEVLTGELTAINQYFIHAKMCDNWGYRRLAERILYFDGVPNMMRLFPIRVGETVPEQFQVDVELEYSAVERLNRGINLAVDKDDNGTRELLAQILVSEEDHIDWLETQQETIRQIGLEQYLAQQLHA
jgi:bacterioferritin